MPPRRTAGHRARRHSGGSRLGRTETVELREDRGRLALVASAELGEVGVRDVSGRVLELELANGAEGDALVLVELLPAVERERKKRSPGLGWAAERPAH